MKLIGKTLIGLIVMRTTLAAWGGEMSAADGFLKLQWSEKTGVYAVIDRHHGWEFSGKLSSASKPATQTKGADALAPTVR